MLVNGQGTIKEWKLTHPAAVREGTKHYYRSTIIPCLEYISVAPVLVSTFFLQIVHKPPCLYLCIDMGMRGVCDTTITPHPPPTSTPNNGWPSLVPEGFDACLFLRPQLLLHPMMNAPVVGHWARASSPSLWGKLRILISAVIGGNWKLSVPLGRAGGPRPLSSKLLELVTVLYHTCVLKATDYHLTLIGPGRAVN